MANLTLVVTRSGETRRHALPSDRPVVIGRGQDADIVVADISISRHQLTLLHAGDCAEFEVSAGSRNQVLLNNYPVKKGQLRPGDRLSVGYCSFELVAESEVPVARPALIPPDPAGFIDVSLVEQEQRIAPRWMASVEDAESARKKKAAAQSAQGKPKTLTERVVLPGALVLLMVLVVMVWFRPGAGDTNVEAPPETLDIFGDPPPVDCADPEECFGRAKRAYELGLKLAQQSGADSATMYKAARQFQIASMALKGQPYRLPELQPRYDAARKKVFEAFADARLRLIRAQQDKNPTAMLAAIEEQLALLQDSKHPYRDTLLRARVKVREVRSEAQRKAIQSGSIFR